MRVGYDMNEMGPSSSKSVINIIIIILTHIKLFTYRLKEEMAAIIKKKKLYIKITDKAKISCAINRH